jgi:DNA-binding response OmpR family regulator
MKILLLEDETLLNDNIKDFFEFKEIFVESYVDGAQLLKKSNFDADVAILDIEVPGASGFEVIEWIKQVNADMPIIFITAYTDIESIEKAYSLGCTDYLKKPFDLIELYLRVQQLTGINKSTKIQLNHDIVFDMQNEQLYEKDELHKLTKIQRAILKVLIKNKNSIVSYEILINEIWNGNFIKVNTIASHIKELRKYVPNEMIESIRAEGYRLHLT